jgi:hypothetical protein
MGRDETQDYHTFDSPHLECSMEQDPHSISPNSKMPMS